MKMTLYSTTRTPWLIVMALLLAMLALPAMAEQTSVVTLTGKIDRIEGNELLLNDFPLTLTASTQVYSAGGKAASVGKLRTGMRVEAIVQAPARTVQVINILR